MANVCIPTIVIGDSDWIVMSVPGAQ